jgi:hypothetical protein
MTDWLVVTLPDGMGVVVIAEEALYRCRLQWWPDEAPPPFPNADALTGEILDR